MQEYFVRQGDQYSIPFPIMLDGCIVDPSLIDDSDPNKRGDIEIIIGELRKTYMSGEIKFNPSSCTFDFPLLQSETFDMYPGMRMRSQVRVKLKPFNGDNNFIYGYDGPDIIVIESMSKERL